jgi:hypothetical protein
VERLRPVDAQWRESRADGSDEKPFYEQYGEKQVAAGHYARVLRYDEHIAPLAKALRSYPQITQITQIGQEERSEV